MLVVIVSKCGEPEFLVEIDELRCIYGFGMGLGLIAGSHWRVQPVSCEIGTKILSLFFCIEFQLTAFPDKTYSHMCAKVFFNHKEIHAIDVPIGMLCVSH